MSIMFLPLRLIPTPVQAVVLSTVLDMFFSRQSGLSQLLHDLEGRVFHIHVRDMGNDLYMGFRGGHVWVQSRYDGEPCVRIDATTAGFARLCFAHENPDDLVFQRVLKLSGDSEAMLRFKKLLEVADIDYERELKAAFGDYFGARVAQAAKALLEVEAQLTRMTQSKLDGYLQNIEVPNAERMQGWQAGVEDFSHQLSRLKGRVTKLEHRLEQLSEPRKQPSTHES